MIKSHASNRLRYEMSSKIIRIVQKEKSRKLVLQVLQ